VICQFALQAPPLNPKAPCTQVSAFLLLTVNTMMSLWSGFASKAPEAAFHKTVKPSTTVYCFVLTYMA